MKRHISYILGSLAIAMLASCVKVDIHPVQDDDTAMVSLTLKSTEPVATRANGDAVEDLNEKKINSVQCFFSNDGENILFSARKEGLTVTNGVVSLNLEISSADLAKLSSPCHVFAVVNCDELQIPDDNKTISKLKETTVTLSKTNMEQTSFVMVGTDSEEGLTKSDNTLSGTVYVKRVAAKVNVILKVAKEIQVKNGDQTETWLPYFNADEDSKISLKFSGKAKTVLADADIVADTQNPSFNSTDGFDVTATAFDGLETPADNVYTVTMQVPFYTYPMSWEDQNDIILKLPWKQVTADGTTVVRFATYEYQIPVQYDNKKLLSNNEYELTVNVGILGNLGTTDLIPSYQVADWGTGKIDAELSRPKYLSVAQKEVVLKNIEEIAVSYSSSDPVEIKVLSENIEEFEYGQNDKVTGGTAVHGVFSVGLDEIQIDEKKKETVIVFRHELENDRTNTRRYDYNVQTVTVQVSHINNPSIKDEITFIQYPAMYVDTNESEGNVFVNGNQSQTSDSDDDDWAHVGGSTQGMSGNLYTISVGAFDYSTDKYMICDPRQSSEDVFTFYRVNSNGTADTNTPVETSSDATGDKTLTGYRATIEGSDSRNLVAPEFMVASGYGWYQITWNNMYAKTSTKYRCAGYQESGYPAGRWRIPTPSELEVIGKLCSEGKIASIFNNGTSYMSSDGPYQYNSTNGTFTPNGGVDANTASVRCIYDTWYWKDKCANASQFIWGADGDIANNAKRDFLVSVVK